jgi:positive phototaxis protein PixI
MQPALVQTNSRDRLQALLPQLFDPQSLVGDRFLRLQIDRTGTTIAIPLEYIEETKTLNGDQITPMPNSPTYLLGLIASKGQVFWALSLAHLWNLEPDWQHRRQQYEVAVVRLPGETEGENWVGLIVPKIRGTLRVDGAAVGAIDPAIPCPIPHHQLQGLISQEDQPLWVIDIDQLRQNLEPSP